MRIISTWIYLDSENEESFYSQVKGNSSSESFQLIYWKCVIVFYATSLRFHKNYKHILFTNARELPAIENFDIEEFFRVNHVEVMQIDNTYPTPEGYYHSWKNQFFEFSIIDNISKLLESDDMLLMLDSDCVFRRNIDDAFAVLEKQAALTYVIDYSKDQILNGINRYQMHKIFSELGLHLDDVPKYSGGEVLFAKGDFIKALASAYPELWEILIKRHIEKKDKFNEEAHVLSYFYYKFGANIGAMNPFIKRLWTNPYSFRNIERYDYELSIWHLPHEKVRGLSDLFDRIQSGLDLNALNDQEYINLITRLLLTSRRYLKDLLKIDFYKKVYTKILNKWS